MDISDIQFLTSSAIYRELALRSQEFLTYRAYPEGSELRQLSEDTFFNLAVEYITQTGVPRSQAEQFCNNPDQLTELALRVRSILGAG
ncbi:hypothetical protein [Pseudanabaena sp. FACHB-2040]|uniref:hypothetical protein n=1 Tax=Pseudanabaena sp. FACHB-2040 TaxID=2692859 RepID=UPI00168280CB|nr:hypothetical protein [Pseudanabaena sp. FACHB-2040]MBD2256684.1 hypothetical protein [Pseudanabaena sp. FACHB-2040]